MTDEGSRDGRVVVQCGPMILLTTLVDGWKDEAAVRWAAHWGDDLLGAWGECERADWLVGIAIGIGVDRATVARSAVAATRAAVDPAWDGARAVLAACDALERSGYELDSAQAALARVPPGVVPWLRTIAEACAGARDMRVALWAAVSLASRLEQHTIDRQIEATLAPLRGRVARGAGATRTTADMGLALRAFHAPHEPVLRALAPVVRDYLHDDVAARSAQ